MNEVTLETERLIMRMWRESDFDEYAELCADPEVMRFLGGKVFDRTEAWRQMASMIGHWYLRGYGIWAVEEKRAGALRDALVVSILKAGRALKLAGRSSESSGGKATRLKLRAGRLNMGSMNSINRTSLV